MKTQKVFISHSPQWLNFDLNLNLVLDSDQQCHMLLVFQLDIRIIFDYWDKYTINENYF